MIATGTQNENSSYVFIGARARWVCRLLGYSSFDAVSPRTCIGVLVRDAIFGSHGVVDFGSLSERREDR